MLINVILGILIIIIDIWIANKLRQFQKEKNTQLREILLHIIIYLAIGRFTEVCYNAFDSDLDAFRRVIGQFYITLDVLVLVLFVSM